MMFMLMLLPNFIFCCIQVVLDSYIEAGNFLHISPVLLRDTSAYASSSLCTVFDLIARNKIMLYLAEWSLQLIRNR
jgi:hypothetical protein